MNICQQEQEVQWAKEVKEDERTNSWAGLQNVTTLLTFAHILCVQVNCYRQECSNFPIFCDTLQLIFWVPINNGNSEPNAEKVVDEVVDEVVEAEVLVLGAGMDVFLRHSWHSCLDEN